MAHILNPALHAYYMQTTLKMKVIKGLSQHYYCTEVKTSSIIDITIINIREK